MSEHPVTTERILQAAAMNAKGATPSNPNYGKIPVSEGTYKWMAEHTPSALAGVYNMNDQRAELLWRVNARVQGRNPGEPMNWAGLRGFAR